MKNILTFISLSLITILLTSATTIDSVEIQNKWEKLGSKKVDFKIDRDVIHVGAKEGVFSKLKLVVGGGTLNMHKMEIEYLNGQKENINLKHQFEKKTKSKVIDLKGNKRIIKNITFWYDTNNQAKRKARVTVFGK